MNILQLFFLFLFQPTNAQLYITTNSICLCDVYFYIFRHLCVILRQFQNFCLAKLRKFLKLWLLILQFHKIIRLKYTEIVFGSHRVIQYILFYGIVI
jgi:hypothetical protein